MKNSPYSPDDFMSGLYERYVKSPYADAKSLDDAEKIGQDIKRKASILFPVSKFCDLNSKTELIGTNGLHPLPEGYMQVADAVFRNLVHLVKRINNEM